MRFKVVALSILVAFTAIGCQKNSKVAEESIQVVTELKEELVPEEGAELTIMVDDLAYGNALVQEFNSIYPNVAISVVTGDSTMADHNVRLKGPRGEGLDVFFMAHDRLTDCVEYGLILPIDEEVRQRLSNQLLDSALKAGQVNGITYGLPITAEALAVYYNKDLVGEVPAKSFEEIFDLAQTYSGQQNKYAFLTNIWDAYNAYAILSGYGFNLFGEDGEDIDNPGIDTEAFEKGLSFVQKLKTIMPNISGQSYADFLKEEFKKGNVAYVYDGPWMLDEYRNSGINLGVTTIPTVDGNVLTPFGGIINAHISSYTKYPQAATLLVEYMASLEGANILYQTRQKAPVLKDISGIKGLKDDEATQMFIKQFEVAKPMPSNSRINYYWEIVPKSISAIIDEGKSPEEIRKWTSETWDLRVSGEYFGN